MVYEKEEKEFETVFNVIRTGRSLAVQYNLQNDFQCQCRIYASAGYDFMCFVVFILSQNSTETVPIASQCPTVIALIKGCKSATVVEDSAKIPEGCGSSVLSSTLSVHVLVKVSAYYCLFARS